MANLCYIWLFAQDVFSYPPEMRKEESQGLEKCNENDFLQENLVFWQLKEAKVS